MDSRDPPGTLYAIAGIAILASANALAHVTRACLTGRRIIG